MNSAPPRRRIQTLKREPLNAEQEAVREEFLQFVRGLSEEDLRQIQPLPYRRVLSDNQARRIEQRLTKCWGVNWWPLRAGYPEQMPSDVLVLQERHFYV